MEESIHLVLRLRPPRNEGTTFWTAHQNSVQGEGNDFNAESVYDPSSTNLDIFTTSINSLVGKCCEGYNTAIMAYGQSGAGKTHTLLGNEREDGLVAFMVKQLFSEVEQQQKAGGRSFLVQLQVMELYCEKIRDLLVVESSSFEPKILEANNIPRVNNLKEVSVTTAKQALDFIEQAQSRRVVGSTELNDVSSRSHAIVQLTIESSMTVPSAGITDNKKLKCRRSVMSIVDLAGSENSSANSGIRAKEGQTINLSLLTLTKVINQLTEKNGQTHISYRDSKLTRLLKPCLGGNSNTLMICCIDPQNKDESLRTLKFSQRLKLVKAHVKANEEEEGGQLNTLLDEIERLKKELSEVKQAKEGEDDKAKRLEELKAQIIDGSLNNNRPMQARVVRRQTICASSSTLSFGSSFSPPMKKRANFLLPQIADVEPPRRLSSPERLLSSISVTSRKSDPEERRAGSGNMSKAPVDLEELDELRHKNFQFEMDNQRLKNELIALKKSSKDQIEELNTMLFTSEEKIATLQCQIESSENLVRGEQEANGELQVEMDCQRLKGKLATLEEASKNQIAELNGKISSSEIKMSSLQSKLEANADWAQKEQAARMELQTKNGELERLKQEIDMANDRCTKAETELSTLTLQYNQKIAEQEKENEHLKERIGNFEITSVERDKLVRRIDELADEAARYKNECERMKISLDDEHDVVAAQKETIRRLELGLKEASTLQEIQKKEMAAAAVAAKDTRAQLEREHAEKIMTLETQLKKVERQSTMNMDAVLLEKEAELKQLEENYKKLETDFNQALESHRNVRAQVVAEIEAVVSEQMTKDRETIAQFKSELLSLQSLNAKLSREHDDYERLVADHTALKATFEAASTGLEESNATISELNKRINDLSAKENEAITLQKTVKELKQTISRNDDNIKFWKNKAESQNMELRERASTIVAMELEVAELNNSKTSDKQIYENSLKFLNEDHEKERECFKRNKNELEEKIIRLEKLSRERATKVMIVESELNLRKKELVDFREQFNRKLEEEVTKDRETAHSQVQEKLSAAEAEIIRLKEEVKKQAMISEKALAQVHFLESRIPAGNDNPSDSQLVKEIARLKREKTDLEDELQNMINKENRRPAVNEDAASLRSDLSQAQKELNDALGKLKESNSQLKDSQDTITKKEAYITEGVSRYKSLVAEHNSLLAEHKMLNGKYQKLKKTQVESNQ